jgi:gliding motility-associated-like protein
MKYKLTLLLLLVYVPMAFSQPIDYNYKQYNTPTPSVNKAVLRTTATEICNNLIDDDNNGLTDEKDFACFFNGSPSASCKQSSVIWTVDYTGSLYWADVSTGNQHIVGQLPLGLVDITWASNGKLYGCGGFTNGIYEIDPNTAGGVFLGSLPNGYTVGNAMTADTLGNLYLTASVPNVGTQIFKLNIATWELCFIVDLRAANLIPAGDLTFLNGMLYMTATSNSMVQINVRTGDIVVQTFNNATPTAYFGVASMSDGYFYVCAKNSIYQVNPVTMAVSSTPTISIGAPTATLYGLATYTELCQSPGCLANTSIQSSSNPPFCIDIGVRLIGGVIPKCSEKVLSVSWTTANGSRVNGDQVKAILPGTYYLNYITAKETCDHVDSFTLQYGGNTPLQVDTAYTLPAGCLCTGTMTVIPGCGSGHYAYAWSTGATTATVANICPGAYSVKVTDIDWLKDTTIDFYIPPPTNGIQRADIIASGDHCNQADGSITIATVQGGTSPFQYALNSQPFGTSNTFAPLPKGTYTITIHDNAGCSLQRQVTIAGVPGPEKLWYTKKDAYCGLPGGTVVIDSVKNGSPPYSFAIDNGAFSQQTTWPNLPPGQNVITVKDNYGCQFTESLTINQSEALQIAISPTDTIMCASEKITFNSKVLGNNEGVQFAWDYGRPTIANTYTAAIYADKKMVVQATDKYGCLASDTCTITANYCDSLFANCVRFPNAFSPNQDGLNDTFGAHLGSCEIKSYQLTVYNRWGQIIFQTRDIFQRWNGTINGYAQQTGTYVYSCQWEDILGVAHTSKGTLALIK